MARKLYSGEHRGKMLRRFTDRKFSTYTTGKIADTFEGKSQEERELHAQMINSIIDSSRTEEEILEKVMKLSKTI